MNTRTQKISDHYVDCSEALLHRSGPGGLLRFLKDVPENKTQAEMNLHYFNVLFRWEALLAGLLFYTRRVVEACLAEVPDENLVDVRFNLLGQGWDLLRILALDMNNPAPVQVVLNPRFGAIFAEIAHTRGTALFNLSVSTLPTTQEAKTAVVRGVRELRQDGGPAAPPMHAAAADIRKTFVGMTIFDTQDQPIIDQHTRLEDVTIRPNWPRDPGYGKLLDELFDAIPEFIPWTAQQPWRERVKHCLLTSARYQRQYGVGDVRQDLIHRGQDDLNRDETWSPGSTHPSRSLLAGFLTSVWRPVWASTEL